MRLAPQLASGSREYVASPGSRAPADPVQHLKADFERNVPLSLGSIVPVGGNLKVSEGVLLETELLLSRDKGRVL